MATLKEKMNDSTCEMIEYLDSLDGRETDPYVEKAPPKENIPFRPHILVIDDDPMFRARIRHIANERQLPITICGSIKELQVLCDSRSFDIAVVDYYLDDLKAYMRGTDVADVLESTPVILISNTDHGIENNTPFPQSVRKFLNKKIGINAILDTALQAAENLA